MKIEILPKDGYRGVFSVYIEEEFFTDIHASIFGKKPKLTFHLEDLHEQFFQQEYLKVKAFVLRRLSQRNYSSFELKKKLKECLVSTRSIEGVLDECRHLGYLDDQSWLEGYISTLQIKKMGPRAIMMKLQSKGVPEEAYLAILAKVVTPENQLERIVKLLETRYKTRDLTDYKEKQKVIASLLRKGFDFELISSCVNN